MGGLGGPPLERGDDAPVLGFCVTEINVGTMWFLPQAFRGDAARKGARSSVEGSGRGIQIGHRSEGRTEQGRKCIIAMKAQRNSALAEGLAKRGSDISPSEYPPSKPSDLDRGGKAWFGERGQDTRRDTLLWRLRAIDWLGFSRISELQRLVPWKGEGR